MPHFDTSLVHLGRDSGTAAQVVNPPLVRASTVTFDSLAAYRQSYHQPVFDVLRYGRSGTSTTFELQRAMAGLEGAECCLAMPSGLAAIGAVLAAHAGPGSHLLVSQGVYGPTRVFCETELAASGATVEFFAPEADLSALIRPETRLVFIETPASLTMEMLDVRAVCAAAHARGVPVAADSTWGTPVFFRAHELGIDLSIHAATKFINGHSDVMLGVVTGSRAHMAPVRGLCDRRGLHAAPDACWLALRGLRTLGVRVRRHQATALQVAGFLQGLPQVLRVLFPALPSDPGHALWRAQFSGAAGPFTIELASCTEAEFARFIDSLALFKLGPSWGGFESLVLPAVPYALRTLKVMPDEGRMVRLHVGLEDGQDLCDDLAQAFAAM